MGRDLTVGLENNEEGLTKIRNILDGANLYGINLRVSSGETSPDITIGHHNVVSPVIHGKKEIVEDLCHTSRSSQIPCQFKEDNRKEINIILPHLPEENLDGLNPTMCLENEIRFLEIVLTRYIKKWSH